MSSDLKRTRWAQRLATAPNILERTAFEYDEMGSGIEDRIEEITDLAERIYVATPEMEVVQAFVRAAEFVTYHQHVRCEIWPQIKEIHRKFGATYQACRERDRDSE